MPMDLTFNPALTVQTRVPVASDGTVHLHFAAAFGSRDAYEHARDTGAYVEMWTNLPAGDCGDEWHALRFKYAVSPVEDKGGRVISLAPPADALGAPDAGRAVSLDLALKDVHAGSSFSFTYRIVYSSGHIEWLGAYGRNGTLLFESGDDRLEWAAGWTLTGNEATKQSTNDGEERPIAALNKKLEWICWAFGEHGWPTLSAAKEVPSSKTVILIPQRPSSSVVEPQPILLSVLGSGSFRIDKNGCIHSEQAQALQVVAHALNVQNALAVLQKVLPASSQVLELASHIKCIVVATPSSHDITFPIALSFIPFIQQESSLNLPLRNTDLKAIEAIVESSELVLTTPTKTAFCFMGSEETEDVTVLLGKRGGQLLLSEIHALNSPHPSPWKFAMLSPTACAQVEPAETASALPTPPPSPPPMGVPFMSRRSLSRDTAESVETVVPITIPSYQSFQSLAESCESESETVVPLSPTSIISNDKTQDPEDEPTTDTQEEMEVELEDSQQLTATPRPSMTMNDGFLRFLFAWFVRAFLARVWGFVDTGFRWIGFSPFILGQGMRGQLASGGPTTDIGTVIAQQINGPSSATIQEIESVEAAPTESADEEEHSVGVEETYAQEEVNIPLHQPVPVLVTAPITPPTLVSPIVRRHKARFLADVRSNIVSFLVHAPHVHAKLSELSISINEKRVESGQGYSCSQLSEGVYLLGLQGPESGSKVEVVLD